MHTSKLASKLDFIALVKKRQGGGEGAEAHGERWGGGGEGGREGEEPNLPNLWQLSTIYSLQQILGGHNLNLIRALIWIWQASHCDTACQYCTTENINTYMADPGQSASLHEKEEGWVGERNLGWFLLALWKHGAATQSDTRFIFRILFICIFAHGGIATHINVLVEHQAQPTPAAF